MCLLLPTPPCSARQQIGSLWCKTVSTTRCLQGRIGRKTNKHGYYIIIILFFYQQDDNKITAKQMLCGWQAADTNMVMVGTCWYVCCLYKIYQCGWVFEYLSTLDLSFCIVLHYIIFILYYIFFYLNGTTFLYGVYCVYNYINSNALLNLY